jgi:CheY-like chemotaxis protein/nitrogen-specific signal transduction histidine kinase
MRPEDFRPEDLFAQIQALVDGLAAERRAREAAEAADKAKSELIDMIGHELRTPMQGVIDMSALLLASPLDGTQLRYTETLAQSARSLLDVLNDVLDFSKLEAGRFELDQASFDLHELVNSVAAVLQTRANEKGLTSGVDIGASCPRFVIGDAARIRQVLMSLIDTALKFTSIGSVRLHAGATDEDGRLRLRFDVTDTGVGLSRAVQERLFQPCVQIDGAIAGQGGDAGLGLPIARKLAELMGGVVGCESVVGQGSLYWFTLPAEQAGAGAPAAKQAKEGAPQGRLSGHVLVVEDNAVNRMLIGTYLEEFGLTHEMVDSGGGAVMNLATKTYDLVLMDIMMPDLDGIETTKRIRSLHAPSSEVPIVALVAPAMKGNCGAYLSAGMDAYVAKPIRGRELYAALAPLLAAGQPELKLKLVKA